MNNRYHVVPVGDLKQHTTGNSNCWCEPLIQPALNCDLVIHNAADGREFFEELDEEEKRAIEAGLQDVAAGRVRPLEDIRRKLIHKDCQQQQPTVATPLDTILK